MAFSLGRASKQLTIRPKTVLSSLFARGLPPQLVTLEVVDDISTPFAMRQVINDGASPFAIEDIITEISELILHQPDSSRVRRNLGCVTLLTHGILASLPAPVEAPYAVHFNIQTGTVVIDHIGYGRGCSCTVCGTHSYPSFGCFDSVPRWRTYSGRDFDFL
jgi:hypothetical protein